jgi:hypothetical protein
VKTSRRIGEYLYAVEVRIPLEQFKDKTQDEKRAIVHEAIEAEVKRIDADTGKHKGWGGSSDIYQCE